ncbi:MAG: DUF4410 domain-containing protein [Deltaproteobacteria bacterium]|jgi:hypothetical protein|nr:DUF4410 domain-containing protein [Deltaproteobacteria bacterium]
MKSILSIIFLISVMFTFGCSTKTTFIPISGAPNISPSSTFRVGEITDKSGFTFPADEDEVIDLKQAMTESLRKALAAKEALAAGGAIAAEGASAAGGAIAAEGPAPWTIAVDIIKYEPGNAFSRWLMPGAGSTKLSTVAYISDKNAQQVAKISVERSIGFGGAYTIGAWKYVFDEVATEIVDTLVDPTKRNQ